MRGQGGVFESSRHPRFLLLPHTHTSKALFSLPNKRGPDLPAEKQDERASSDNRVALGSAGTENSSAEATSISALRGGRQPEEKRGPLLPGCPHPSVPHECESKRTGKAGKGERYKRCSVAERGCLFLLDGRQGRGEGGNRGAAEQNGERRLMGRPGSRRAKAHLSRPAVNSEARMLEPEVARPTLASSQGPYPGSSLSLC
ncbi:hypothetical protein CEXT_244511 [Caerostris extrusa]|uniref:Uncharacterized protein n=1 Tax=Caerostris extrusa TaxID=172846 RepID=A0AAV4VKS6_CAEEX|nr:hypothetical protein CEXT_244511 [Caerostris extrusa]